MKLDDATADRLRELGAAEDMLQWLREPETVRKLLDRQMCERCVTWPHDQDCEVAAAWRKLGMPQAEADLLSAWDEALRYTWHDIEQTKRRNAHERRMRQERQDAEAIREWAANADARQIAGNGSNSNEA